MLQKSSSKNHSVSLLIVLVALFAGGCTTLSYYGQAVTGHMALVSARQPIKTLLAQENTPPALKNKLREVNQIRQFAITELGLPDNGSYRHYADLGRDAATYLVAAAPATDLTPHQWCYFYIGCLSYRGYFNRKRALETAQGLGDQGFDTFVAPVPAYSTLGWMKDPVLNTMVDYRPLRLAELIIHEMTHALIYLPGDAQFNESLATAVGRIGAEQYALRFGLLEELIRLRATEDRLAEVDKRLNKLKNTLMAIYAAQSPDDRKLRDKQAAVEQFRQSLVEDNLADPAVWYPKGGPNNAHLVLHSTYESQVDDLLRLYRKAGSVTAFFDRVFELAELDRATRSAQLAAP